MRLLFVLQGEGRGHMTQALALKEMVVQQGHEVVAALVGRSFGRVIPEYFVDRMGCPVRSFESPNFVVAGGRRILIARSVVVSLARTPAYLRSFLFLRRLIRSLAPDMVVSFYEPLCGLACALRLRAVPYVTLAHQYLLLHPGYMVPPSSVLNRAAINTFSLLCAPRAVRRLALSFAPMRDLPARRLFVVPPLLRRRVRELRPTNGAHILGYMLNPGYSREIIAWHERNPGIECHFFWDRRDAPEDLEVRPGLHFHRLHDEKFLSLMASCRGYAGTAGFESVCEALYLRKPVLVVPTAGHVEQQCNALEAHRIGAGVAADGFDLDRLLAFIPLYDSGSDAFRAWADRAEEIFLRHLREAAARRGRRRRR